MALLDAVSCGLVQTDANGLILRANALFCAWVGRDSGALVGQVKVQDLFTIGGRIFHQTHWVPLLQMQRSLSEVKFDVVHANGDKIPMVANAIRHTNDDGTIVHELSFFVARDRDRYERELLQSGKRLKELVAELVRLEEVAKDRALFAEQMMGIVSHDLRNPLHIVEMSVLSLSSEAENPQRTAALARITRAIARADRLVHDLLDFTQIRIGQGLSVTVRPLDLHTVIAECVDELRHAFPDRTLLHAMNGEGKCSADAHRLSQLVSNLVSNAVAYGASNAPVTITSTIGDGAFQLDVHNSGPAIADDIRASIFVPMSRGNAKGNAGSIGLGLYIVRAIAIAHGGDVSLASTTTDGTTFSVSFPCRMVVDE